jgi:hypothetical protein
LGDSAGTGLEEAPAGSGLEAAQVDEDGAPLALGKLCAPLGLGGFRSSGAASLVLGVGGLIAFGDSPPTGALLVEDSRLISLVILHRGS